MTGITKSILLQVAFKGAVEMGVVNAEQVLSNYELLTSLHDKLGIDPDEGRTNSNSGGAARRRSGGGKPQPQGETFIFNGVLVEDFRKAKADPSLGIKPNYPDFKTAKGEVIEGITTDRGAAWLYDQDGNANDAVAPLVEAADQKVF